MPLRPKFLVFVCLASTAATFNACRRRNLSQVRSLESGQSLVISEFLADNDHSQVDEDGDQSDWIELHNATTATLNTSGWALSDDPAQPRKWPLPESALGPDAYLLVFASGKNRSETDKTWHTNFKLAKDGGNLILTSPSGDITS